LQLVGIGIAHLAAGRFEQAAARAPHAVFTVDDLPANSSFRDCDRAQRHDRSRDITANMATSG
jgi:hypothetical protein